MLIRYGDIKDFSWVKEHDHVSEDILRSKIENKELYVVENNGKIIGWLRYNLFWDNIPFMNMIYFLEEYRKKGFGAKLVKHWEEEMKQKGYKHLMTSTQSNEEGQHFYRKIGYTEIGGVKFLDDPFEIIFFKKIE